MPKQTTKPQEGPSAADIALSEVLKALTAYPRVAVWMARSPTGWRIDRFELFASPAGTLMLHTQRRAGKLVTFEVYGQLGAADHKLATLLRDIKLCATPAPQVENPAPINPDMQWEVSDDTDVVVAIVAHRADAELLARARGYAYTSDSSPDRLSAKVGQDSYRSLDAQSRRECELPPRNPHAVR